MGKIFNFEEGVKQRNARYIGEVAHVVFEDLDVYVFAKIKFITDTIVFESDIWTEDAEAYALCIDRIKIGCLLAFDKEWNDTLLGTFDFFHVLDKHIEKYVEEVMKDFDEFVHTEIED
jgi:hypothetical protein